MQVPAKDMPLAPPGSNMPPITKFKKVREFPSAGECEAYRDVALQDGAMDGLGGDARRDLEPALRRRPSNSHAPTPRPTP